MDMIGHLACNAKGGFSISDRDFVSCFLASRPAARNKPPGRRVQSPARRGRVRDDKSMDLAIYTGA